MCFISASAISSAGPGLVETLLWDLVRGLCIPTSETHVNRSIESWNNVMGAGGRWCRKGEARCAGSEAGEGSGALAKKGMALKDILRNFGSP